MNSCFSKVERMSSFELNNRVHCLDDLVMKIFSSFLVYVFDQLLWYDTVCDSTVVFYTYMSTCFNSFRFRVRGI